MRATARVVALAGRGRTRLATLRSEAPLLLRPTGPAGDGGVRVHLVGGAAGPLGGDRLRLEIEVGPEACLCLRTVAASVALPGPAGAAGTTPRPGGACRRGGADLARRTGLRPARRGARRRGGALSVSYGGEPLYQHELAVGPDAPGWDGPAVLDGAPATGSLLRVRPEWAAAAPEPVLLGPTAAHLPLAGPGVVTTATAPDAAALRRHLDQGVASWGDGWSAGPGMGGGVRAGLAEPGHRRAGRDLHPGRDLPAGALSRTGGRAAGDRTDVGGDPRGSG
jgi:urease accessory protein